jgi:PAS domain S-box-containing protein
MRHVVERRRDEQALQESRERLQLALDAALLGWWQYDPIRRAVWQDTRLREMFELPDDWIDVEEFKRRVHPDDIERVSAALEAAIDPTKPKQYATEFRYRRGDGKVRWTEAHGLVRFEGSGRERRAVSMVGTAQDITERKQGEEERKRHEELLQRQADLLNQSHDAILTMQTDGRGIVYWSRGAERLYGYTAAEAEGRRAHELLRTRAPISIEDIDAQIAHEGSWYGELTHTTRDGRDIVVESRIVRVSYNGDTFALETNRDITKRKRAEEQLRLLMREMNHRAKNMLSVVDAIAHQTATRNPDDFIERFSERIQALSANQELLVRNEWKGVEIESLVRAQLAHFADLIGSRIAVQGPVLRLNPTGAQAIGLALHELATNAGKYGALSTEAGRVDIRWGTEGETFTMSWTERGGPPVSPPRRRGFGAVVMKEMAERNAGGSVELDYAPSGATWSITCPAANALEPRERGEVSIESHPALPEDRERHEALKVAIGWESLGGPCKPD